MNKIKQSILAIVIGLVLSAGVSYAEGIWKNPEENPPNKNTETPINVGRENQTKAGGVFFTNPIGGGINVNGAANFMGVSQFTSGLRITSGSPGVGKVLTSTDIVGTVSWQTPAVSSSSSSYSPMIDIKSKTCSPSSADCEVTCISGYTLVSGGFKGEKQMASYPTNNNSWRTIAWDYSGSNDTTIYAVCIKK